MYKFILHLSLLLFLLKFDCLTSQVFDSNPLYINDICESASRNITSIDVNNDGLYDLVHHCTQKLAIYINTGNSSYEKAVISKQIEFLSQYSFEYVDDDNYIDLIISENSIFGNELSVIINDGQGNFTNLINITPIGLNSSFNFMDIGKNNEEEINLIISSHTENKLMWVVVDKNLNSTIVTNIETEAPTTLFNVDIDCDGTKDFLFISFTTKSFYWIKNDNTPNFNEINILPILDGADSFIQFEDINNDGIIDIYFPFQNIWYQNNCGGSFDKKIVEPPFSENENLAMTVIGDIDGDSDTDIIRWERPESGEANLFLYSNNGEGIFYKYVLENLSYSFIHCMHAVKLDNDNKIDLIICEQDELIGYKNTFSENILSGVLFFDENNNGNRDINEKAISYLKTMLEPDDNKNIRNEFGNFIYYIDDGEYSINYLPHENWKLSSDSTSYSLNVYSNSYDNLDFGFIPRDTFMGGLMHGVSGITRCNSDVRFDFTFQNQGTTIITEGILWVFQDSLTELANTQFPIDTMLDERTFGWKFENLYPGQTTTRIVELSVPGFGGDFQPGTLIEILSATEAKNNQGTTNYYKHNYSEEIRCAYDPNDKLISPLRPEDENYTLFGDTLIYTVRFQNTGNDTAFNVVIRDTLDQNLDVSTFNIIHSSHRSELSTDIQDGRNVTFNFENILLPDSTINFVGSQGYVTYTIQAKDPVPEFTAIENTASIYFDFNPPIVTNTTLNTMVSCYPIEEQFITATLSAGEVYELPDGSSVDQAGVYNVLIEDEEGCPIESYVVTLDFVSITSSLPLQNAIGIAPNPSTGVFTLELDVDGVVNYHAVISDPMGKEIKTIQIRDKQTLVYANSFTTGVYFLQVLDEDGELLGVKKFVVGSGL